jgi:GAF domain-containing protein/HAMP domain-containing protein
MNQEETTTTSAPVAQQAQQAELFMVKNTFDDQGQRAVALQRVGLLFGILTLIAGAGYGLAFIQAQAWQGLVLAAVLWLNSGLFFVARDWARQGQPDRAAYGMIVASVVTFPLGELLWAGTTPAFTIGVVALNIGIAYVGLPRRQLKWGVAAGCLGAGLVLLIGWSAPLPRYDSRELGLLANVIPGAISVAVLIIFLLSYVFSASTIRNRLLISFSSVALLTAVVISGVSILFTFQDQQEDVIDRLESVAVSKEAEIRSWVEGLQTELRLFLTQHDILLRIRARPIFFNVDISALEDGLARDFVSTIEITGRFDEIFLIDREGKVVSSSNPDQKDKNFGQEPFFQKGLAGAYVQPPGLFPTQDQLSIIVVEPILDQDGQTALGVLVGRTSLERVNEILAERTGIGETGEVYLVGLNRVLLTRSRFEGYEPGKTYVRTQGVDMALSRQDNGRGLYDDYRGVSVVGAYRWLPELQVALLAEQDQAEAFQPIQEQLIRDILVAGGAILVVIVFSLLVARTIANPLSQLTHTATQIAAGNLELQADVSGRDEIGHLARAFNSMTAQLREVIGSLEERVRERTQALEAGALISRQLTTILDLDELLQRVVNNIQQTFNYYHVHIYLRDGETGELVIREGSGPIGQQLKAQGHRLAIGQGLVGGAAQRGRPVLAKNVNDIADFVRNPLLPKTQAELAIPLRKGGEILGVLDLQSEEVGGFDEEDMVLMQAIADQVAVAVDNAQLFRRVQAAAAEAEALNRRLTRETWRDIDKNVQATGYTFTKSGLTPDPTEWLPAMDRAIHQRSLAQDGPDGNGHEAGDAQAMTSNVAVPLVLRGEVIGVIGIERSTERKWSEDELTTVRAIAEQVSLALDAARLARETQRSAWRDQVVSESTAQIWSSDELEEVMRAAVAQLGDKLRASEVVIRLGAETELEQY